MRRHYWQAYKDDYTFIPNPETGSAALYRYYNGQNHFLQLGLPPLGKSYLQLFMIMFGQMLRRSIRYRYFLLSSFISVVVVVAQSSTSLSHYLSFTVQKTFASSSPSFVRQEVIYNPQDWRLWKENSGSYSTSPVYTHAGYVVQIPNAKDISQCKRSDTNDKFITPGIDSVSYISNGRFLNSTIWLASPFVESPLNDTLDVYQKQLEIEISNLTSHDNTLQKYTTVKMAELFNPLETTIEQQSNFTIAGNPAHKVVYNTTTSSMGQKVPPLKKMEVWTIKNTKVYDITYSASSSRYNDYLPTIQKMLDSFRIGSTKPVIATTISKQYKTDIDFLTYQRYGIKVDYPAHWQKEEYVHSNNNDNSTNNANDKTIIIKFLSPFEDQSSPLQPSYHEVTFTMAIDVASSVNDQGTGYRVKISRIPHNVPTGTWTKQILEVSAHDKTRVLEEDRNYTSFYDKSGQQQPYIMFSFDLAKINYPQQYKVLFYITDYFVLRHIFCRLVDTTNWIIIPPPEFTLSTNPNAVVLRPGEEKDVGVVVKGNTNLPSQVFLNATNNNGRSIELNFIPDKTSIPPLSTGTSTLHIRVLKNANATSYTLPISANISFPTTIRNKFGENFSNSRSESLLQLSNLTLTVQPPYTIQEQLNNFVNSWITPVNGLWSFLAGVAAVVTPLVIRRKQKAKQK